MNNDMNNQNMNETPDVQPVDTPDVQPVDAPDVQPVDAPDVQPVDAPEFQPPVGEPAPAPTAVPGKGLGIAAVVVGALSLVVGVVLNCLCGLLGSFPFFVTAIVAIVLGAIAMKKAKDAGAKNTLALVGLILGIVTLVALVAGSIINAVIGMATMLPGLMESL